MQYVAKKSTYVTGRITGRLYDFQEDHIIEAPEGEFDHVHSTRVRKAEKDEAVDLEPPDTGLHEVGGGWYEIYVDGELKDKKQGEDAAEQRFNELTLPEDR